MRKEKLKKGIALTFSCIFAIGMLTTETCSAGSRKDMLLKSSIEKMEENASLEKADEDNILSIDKMIKPKIKKDLKKAVKKANIKTSISEKITAKDLVRSNTVKCLDVSESPEPTQSTEPEKQATVIAGSVEDVLVRSGDYLIYPIDLNSSVYFQAELIQPNQSNINYDLYLMDSDGNFVAASQYVTKLNTTNGTLPEDFGFVSDKADVTTYYLAVLSQEGGSATEKFTLNYSFSTACDAYEIDENAGQALAFSYTQDPTRISTLSSRNLSSPIDNDWYKLTVPSSRHYDQLQLSISTNSVNTCKMEVFQNIASEGYQMKQVAITNNRLAVTEGTYYLRISNANKMTDFDEFDIQNYSLSIQPIQRVVSGFVSDAESLSETMTSDIADQSGCDYIYGFVKNGNGDPIANRPIVIVPHSGTTVLSEHQFLKEAYSIVYTDQDGFYCAPVYESGYYAICLAYDKFSDHELLSDLASGKGTWPCRWITRNDYYKVNRICYEYALVR